VDPWKIRKGNIVVLHVWHLAFRSTEWNHGKRWCLTDFADAGESTNRSATVQRL
jgi:hypothetical protein